MALAILGVAMRGILGAFGALFLNKSGGGANPVEVEETDGQPPAAKCTVLVIDDDLSMLETIRPLLSQAGFTVLTAQSGAKGLDMLRYAQKDVRVVLLDYNMPRLSGLDTLEYLRKISPTTKVVALSGIATELLPAEYRNNVDRFVPKPFRAVELVHAIDELIGLQLPKVAA